MDRRQFLFVTATSSFALSIPSTAGIFLDSPALFPLAQPELLTLLGDAQRVHDIGLAYRTQFPLENDPTTLAAIIEEECGLPGEQNGFPLQCQISRRVRSDFASRRTLQINGWILAVTEARQCALYSITSA